MRLHELYFGAMTKNQTKIDVGSTLYKKITEDFDSYENWLTDFKATATMRGIGWAILYFDETVNKLTNVWVNEHDAGHLAGCKLLLNLDVFEHAFMIDYGTKRADYIEAFVRTIDWRIVESRF